MCVSSDIGQFHLLFLPKGIAPCIAQSNALPQQSTEGKQLVCSGSIHRPGCFQKSHSDYHNPSPQPTEMSPHAPLVSIITAFRLCETPVGSYCDARMDAL
jgi:hypothetical protein